MSISVYEEYYRILLKNYYIIKIFNNNLLLTQVDNSSLNVAPHYLIEKLLKFSAETFLFFRNAILPLINRAMCHVLV